jgi:hypothetical protein
VAGRMWCFCVKYGGLIHNKLILVISRKESNFVDYTFCLNGIEWFNKSGKTSNEYIQTWTDGLSRINIVCKWVQNDNCCNIAVVTILAYTLLNHASAFYEFILCIPFYSATIIILE